MAATTATTTSAAASPVGAAEAKAPPEGEVIEVEAYENQRYFPLRGWGVGLLPTDRYKWSSRDGRVERRIDEKSPPPPGYSWAGGWELEINAGDDSTPPTTDKEGWTYAFDFPLEFKHRMGGHSWVRRRRWVRRVEVDAKLVKEGSGVGHVVENGKFVLIDEPGSAWDDASNSIRSDAASASSHPPLKGGGPSRVANMSKKPSLDSCSFPEETSASPSGVTTPDHHSGRYAACHFSSPSAALSSDPVERAKQKVQQKWANNMGPRQGSVHVDIKEVHLAQQCNSLFLHVEHGNNNTNTKSFPCRAARANIQTDSIYFLIGSDHTPIKVTVIDDTAGGRRCAGEAHLCLRNCPDANITTTSFHDGRHSEHGEVTIPLYPPANGARVDESLYLADNLGTITLSWTFELRDETIFLGNKILEFCETCGRTAKQCRCKKEEEDDTATESSNNDEGPIPPPKEKCGRMALRVISGNHLVDFTEFTSEPGVHKYLRRKQINPYVVLHYTAMTTPTPAAEPCTPATAHQIVKSNKAIGDAKDDSDVAWGETLVVDVADAYSSDIPMRVEVWDYRTFESNKFLGMAFLDAVHLHGRVATLKLSPRDDEPDPFIANASSLGSLTVRIYWTPYTM